jgi:2-polyprenyl-3-methyl-5-hydroxy-6-metoxy-1,4-benzoquinol methylase
MPAYQPENFWQKAHSAVDESAVKAGTGVRHVGGGANDLEAEALYVLREVNMHRILRKCAPPARPAIFELGSGGGYWVRFFAQMQPAAYVGSDLSETAVARLRTQHPTAAFVDMKSPDAWPEIARRGPYDLCLAIDVLYHITDDGIWEGALRNLCQNCKEGGYVLIADYFYDQARENPSGSHVKHRTMQAYLDVLDEYGLRVEELQPVFYFLNRITSGPWRDHAKWLSPVLRALQSQSLGLRLLVALDRMATLLARPMNPKCKTRILAAMRRPAKAGVQ